jgi:hypothetical protein
MKLLTIGVVAFCCASTLAAAESATGKWNCTNLPSSGGESPWTMTLKPGGGILSDGQVDLPLLDLKNEAAFTFRIEINGQSYKFDGKLDGAKIEGKYNGPEANGTLRCAKAKE